MIKLSCCRLMLQEWLVLLLLSTTQFARVVVAKLQFDDQNNPTCPLLHLFPFSNFHDQTIEEAQLTAQIGYGYLAAAELAVQHFNTRDPVVVSELADAEFADCNVELTSLATVDSRSNKRASIQQLLRELDHQRDDNQQWPCAILGPEDPGGVELVESVTMTYDIWHTSYHFAKPTRRKSPAELALDFKNEKKGGDRKSVFEGPFARRPAGLAGSPPKKFLPSMVPSAEQTSGLILQYLLDLSHGQNSYLALLYENIPEILSMADGITRTGRRLGINIKQFDFDNVQIRVKLKTVQQSGYRTIFPLVNTPRQLQELAEAAEELGMLENDDYLFILNPQATGIQYISKVMGEQPVGSPLDKLLKGALIADFLDGFSLHKEDDRFLQAWRAQNPILVKELNKSLPATVGEYFKGMPDNYFQTSLPVERSTFIYDTVIATGMAACRVAAKAKEGKSTGSTPPPGGDEDLPLNRVRELATGEAQNGTMPPSHPPDTGDKPPPPPMGQPEPPDPFQESFVKTDFLGASGPVAFANGEARSSPAYFGAFNVRAKFNPETGMNSYKAVLVSYTKTNPTNIESGDLSPETFSSIPGETFVYRSGSTVGPTEYRQYNEQNYLSTGVRTFGLSVMALCWLLALTAAVLVVVFRNQPVIRYGQPVFLVLLCLGSIVLAASIYTLSWDEGAGWTEDQLDIACALTPWLFFIGHVVNFSAIFCKLWRLDKVLQVQRRKVGAAQSIGPLFLFLAVTISILSVWTAVDPWQWEREVINDLNAETYGKCTNSNWWAFFAPLMFCVVISEAIAAYFAIKTNDAPDGLSESGSVFYTICVQLQAWALGVPILAVIGTSSADTTYVGRVILIGFFSISSVLFMVGSKVWRVLVGRGSDGGSSDGSRRNHVHIPGLNSPGQNSPGYEQPSTRLAPDGRSRFPESSLTHDVIDEGDPERGKVEEDETPLGNTDSDTYQNPNSAIKPKVFAINQDRKTAAQVDIHPFALRSPDAGAKLTSTEDGECSEEMVSTIVEVDPVAPAMMSATSHRNSKLQPPTMASANLSQKQKSQQNRTRMESETTAGFKGLVVRSPQQAISSLTEEDGPGNSIGSAGLNRNQSPADGSPLDLHVESNLFNDTNLENVSSACADDSIAETERAALAKLDKHTPRSAEVPGERPENTSITDTPTPTTTPFSGATESNLFNDSNLESVSSVCVDDSIAEMERAAVARLNAT